MHSVEFEDNALMVIVLCGSSAVERANGRAAGSDRARLVARAGGAPAARAAHRPDPAGARARARPRGAARRRAAGQPRRRAGWPAGRWTDRLARHATRGRGAARRESGRRRGMTNASCLPSFAFFHFLKPRLDNSTFNHSIHFYNNFLLIIFQ